MFFLYHCQMSIVPPYLQPGDTIGIVCPSGYMPLENAETCIRVLKEWGYKVKTGITLGNKFHYFSGNDDERLSDLQQMMDDDEVQGILCGRGGYGLSRIIDKLNFKKFCLHPKWIMGYSDITLLHSHLITQYNIASIHCPMAAAFNQEEYKSDFVQSLRKALAGETAIYTSEPHHYNHPGKTSAQLVGGNLSMLCHAIGTVSAISTRDSILFIEDVGEYIYNIDRMLYQLKRSGMLDNLAGLIVGSFTDMKDTVIPFGKTILEVIRDVVKEYQYPVCFHFPVGHTKENCTLKNGTMYELEVTANSVTLAEKRN